MALKSKLAKFGFAVGMASIILSVVTWAMAQPSLVIDLPAGAFAFVLRAPTCASVCSYSVCWV
jgi:hypothetical protein